MIYNMLKNKTPSDRRAKVGYDDTPGRFFKNDKGRAHSAAHKILNHKKYNWAYEREWRLLGEYPGQLPYVGDIVTDIYFGSLTKPEHKEQIRSAFAGRSLNFHVMKVTGYRHRWTRL